MDEYLHQETEKLIRSWMQHDAAHLRDYLVAGVEDPRLNLQSIFSRHFLLWALFGERFSPLMEQEYRFGAVMNWLQEFALRTNDREQFEVILHALRLRSDNAEGLTLPRYVLKTFSELPAVAGAAQVPNYIEHSLLKTPSDAGGSGLDEASLNTFQDLWNGELKSAVRASNDSGRPSVLEVACGSANDFRFLQQYGLGRFLEYTGIDLCPKNIENARSLFPEIRFEIGNSLEIAAPNKAFDYGFVHDLFEHLSLEAMSVAARELCRVCARGLCIGFFNMDEVREHQVRPVDEYHWNTLSMSQMKDIFAELGFTAQVFHIATFLRQHVGCEHTHNPNAYTFLLTRRDPVS